MAVGTVHSIDRWDVRGVIVDDEARDTYLVYPSSLASTERRNLLVGERVTFDVVLSARGLMADNVRRI